MGHGHIDVIVMSRFALNDDALRQRLSAYRQRQTQASLSATLPPNQ